MSKYLIQKNVFVWLLAAVGGKSTALPVNLYQNTKNNIKIKTVCHLSDQPNARKIT